MATVQFRDGTLGWTYPKPTTSYQPTRTDLVGVTITDPGWRPELCPVPCVIIREIGRETRHGGQFWVAPVLPDGSLGRMTAAHLTGRECAAARKGSL